MAKREPWDDSKYGATQGKEPWDDPQYDPAPAPAQQPGHIDAKLGKWVPEKRVRAVFTDAPEMGAMTAEEIPGQSGHPEKPKTAAQSMSDLATGSTSPKQNAAFLGGALQGATLGFGDEIAAGIGAATGQGSYRQLRDENRRADKDAEGWDPTLNAAGKLTGSSVLTAGTPSLWASSGKPLISVVNTAKAGALGATQGVGESEADLTKGEVAPAAWDAAKGAAAGVAANTVLGGVGKAYRAGANYLNRLPKNLARKADESLIDAATLGAPASQRDALMGPLGQDRPDVLKLIRSNPEIESALKAGDRQRAALLLREAQAAHTAADEGRTQTIQTVKGNIDVTPVLEKLEAQRAELAANPALEAQAAAAKKQKLIDSIREKFMPSPPPEKLEGNALLGKLMEGADAGDKQRAGVKAKEFLQVANKYKLADVTHDPNKLLKSTDVALEDMGKERKTLYDRLGVVDGVPLGNVTAKLSAWRDELERSMSGIEDVPKVDAMIQNIWRAHGRNGKTSISAEELRDEISKIQKKGFSGSYLDPNKSAEMGRETAARIREALDEHIAKIDASLPVDSEIGAKIADLNKRYAPMIAFRDAAEKRAAAANLLPPAQPETRTGKAAVAALRGMARTTEDEDARRAITGGIYQQIGPEASHELAASDRQGELMSRLQAPLEHKAAREASPATTLRSATHKIADFATDKGATSLGLIGTGLAAGGHHVIGGTTIGAAFALKYGSELGAKAERALGAMVQAQKMGANPAHLMTIAKALSIPASVATELINTVAPRAAVSATSGAGGER